MQNHNECLLTVLLLPPLISIAYSSRTNEYSGPSRSTDVVNDSLIIHKLRLHSWARKFYQHSFIQRKLNYRGNLK